MKRYVSRLLRAVVSLLAAMGIAGNALAEVGTPPIAGPALQDGTWLNGLAGGQNFSYQYGISASGSTQASAKPIPAGIYLVEVDTVPASSGVALPFCYEGTSLNVYNSGSNTLTVYSSIADNPTTGAQDTINSGASIQIPPESSQIFSCANDGVWGTGLPSSGFAPINNPTFTGIVTIPSGSILNTPGSINLANAANGSLPNSALAHPSTTVNGQTCTLGSTCTITAAAGSIIAGTTTVTGGPGVLSNASSGGALVSSTTLPSGLTAPSLTVTGAFTATGLVTNGDLTNSTISGVSLGSNLGTLTFGAHLAAGGTSYNGSAPITITSDATNANTASTIVARDASGNFSAGTITASLTGGASLDLPLAGGALSGPVTSSSTITQTTVVAPASTAALNTAIATAISNGQTGVSLIPGTYSVAKTTTGSDGFPTAVLINAPGNLTLDGQGSTLSLTGADVSSYANIITAQNAVAGTTLTLKNLTLQYASPPFAQAVLSSKTACVANANGSATFTMYSGFAPAWASVLRLDQVNPNANPVTGTVGLFVANVYDDYGTSPLPMTNLGGGSYSLAFNGSAQCTALASSSMTVGYAFTLMNTQFYTEGIKFLGVANVVLDNVRVVDTAGHAFTFIGANNVTIKNGTAVSPALGAWRSSNAGGFAFIATSGVVTADQSTQALATGDDSFFIAPYIDTITLVNSRTSIQTAGVGATPFAVGDTFQFIDPNGVLQGTAIVSGTSTSGGNTVFAFYSPGAPSGVSTSWVMVDRSQAPSLCVISGTYGGSPTRGIWADCNQTVFNQPTVKDTGAGGIYVTYNDGNIGIVPSSVIFNQPIAINTNYAADAFDATYEVTGWNIARTAAATAGQIGTVAFNNPVCQTSGTGCLYAGSAKEVSVSFGSFQSWYQVAGTPANTQGCGTTLYENAVSFCNDTNAVYSPGYFLSGGLEEGYSGSTVSSPALPSSSLVGLTASGSGFGVTPSTWADTQACTAGQVSVDASYIYICTATNTVKRVALSSF